MIGQRTMGLRVLIINPSAEEAPGLLLAPMIEAGCDVVELASRAVVDLMVAKAHVTATVVDRFPPSSFGFDLLVVLGSPLGVLTGAGEDADDQTPRRAVAQIEALIRDFHDRRKPVLGICLGSQLVARTFGGAVTPLPKDDAHTALPCDLADPPKGLEFGWLPLDFSAAAADDALVAAALERWRGATPPTPLAPKFMQLHGDTFAPPPGAVLLATRPTCENQAFRYGASTYAFQCHVEVDEDLSRAWFEEYVTGEDSFAEEADWEPLEDAADVAGMRAAHAAARDEGSILRAAAFTTAFARGLLARAAANKRRRLSRRLGAAAAVAGVAAAVALGLRRAAR